MRRLLPVLFLLSACGSAPDADNQSAVAENTTMSDEALAAALAGQGGGGSTMTAIDAASGDDARMPGEFTGTTAGELAARAREREAAARSAMDRALDAAETLDVDLPDPTNGGMVMGGESAVVETR